MTRCLLIALLAASSTASAVVIRHDVDDSKYRIPASTFSALVDMPGEGHGVLIDPRWVVTAAHTIPWHWEKKQVVINGIARDVERVVVHSGYKKPSQDVLDNALASWDWMLFWAQLAASDDIALLKLAQPATDASPSGIYEDKDEFDQTVRIVGKGATATGATGYEFSSSRRTELRQAYNKITSVHDRYFCYVFNEPSEALPLEGGAGGGDSGGPVLINTEMGWRLAGLTSWSAGLRSTRTRTGQYGSISCNVRLSHYREWIEGVISEQPRAGG